MTTTTFVPADHQPTRAMFNAGQTLATMRITMIGAGMVMIVLGLVGLGLALVAGGHLGDMRAAYSAGLASLLLAGHMVIAVGALRGHRTILKHQLALETILDLRLDRVEEQQDEHLALMEGVRQTMDRTATLLADLLEDELRQRRQRRT